MAVSPRRPELKGTDTPLDYSFLNITTMGEIVNEDPRDAGKKKVEKVLVEVVIEGENGPETKEQYKFNARCLKLNNNLLQELPGFINALSDLILDPNALTWVDLSFNELAKVDACLCDLQSIQILYMHGNQISEIAEVDKLRGMPHVYKLTLHGNPMDTTKGYRNYVIKMMPQLRSLDFSSITRADKANAASFQIVKPQKKKKRED